VVALALPGLAPGCSRRKADGRDINMSVTIAPLLLAVRPELQEATYYVPLAGQLSSGKPSVPEKEKPCQEKLSR
jgi:hypothetical protein